jgi:hypothetical protein
MMQPSYIVPDDQKYLLRLDEAIGRYHSRSETRGLLAGFRPLVLPTGFNADLEVSRLRMAEDLRTRMCADLLFGAVFGRLSHSDVRSFAAHGGVIGLKYALLDCITRHPIASTGQITAALGIPSSSTIREALVMLTATGLLFQKPRAMPWSPTVKGRFLLDLIRRLLWEATSLTGWTNELSTILRHLELAPASFITPPEIEADMRKRPTHGRSLDLVRELIESAMWARGQFGIDALEGVDRVAPMLYSHFDWKNFDHHIPGNPLRADEIGL